MCLKDYLTRWSFYVMLFANVFSRPFNYPDVLMNYMMSIVCGIARFMGYEFYIGDWVSGDMFVYRPFLS